MHLYYITAELPDGCVPLFLSGITQKLFSLKVNEDITRESPIVLVKKEMIISDMKTRAAVSDFSEVKQTILVCTSISMYSVLVQIRLYVVLVCLVTV